MSKGKLLVLLVIMALVFYYLQQEQKPRKQLLSPSRKAIIPARSQPFNSPPASFPNSSPLVSPNSDNEPRPISPPVIELPANESIPISNPETNCFAQLQRDCANYLNWQTGNMVNNWHPYWKKTSQDLATFNSLEAKTQIEPIIASLNLESWDREDKKRRQQDLVKELKKLIPPTPNDEQYRLNTLDLLEAWTEQFTNLSQKSKIIQATSTLQAQDKPRYEYLQAVWSLRAMEGFDLLLAQPLREWINLPLTPSPAPLPTDYGWLTDDNLEFILSNHLGIQQALVKQNQASKKFHLRTDIANIYDNYQRMQTNTADETVLNFIEEQENYKHTYTLFPVRVNGNHWGLFILKDQDCTYQVYYTSSASGLSQEAKQLKPLLDLWVGENTPIKLLKGDKQQDGHNCGVYLVKYIEEILTTGKLELKRQYTAEECQNFRWEWKQKIGAGRWCKWD